MFAYLHCTPKSTVGSITARSAGRCRPFVRLRSHRKVTRGLQSQSTSFGRLTTHGHCRAHTPTRRRRPGHGRQTRFDFPTNCAALNTIRLNTIRQDTAAPACRAGRTVLNAVKHSLVFRATVKRRCFLWTLPGSGSALLTPRLSGHRRASSKARTKG
jgi:5-methylcytosine-specific restriction endonuclease McrA